MEDFPEAIRKFILANHVVGLATSNAGQPWAASCFYAFDTEACALILLTSRETRHAQGMLANANVAGTISGQPCSILKIRGIQFLAKARLQEGEAAERAYRIYCGRHPIARLRRSDIWMLDFEEIKFTDNSRVFANKTLWHRQEANSSESPSDAATCAG